MTLNDWLQRSGKTREELARELDVRVNSISRYVNRRRRPRPQIVAKIREITNGQVTADDLIGR